MMLANHPVVVLLSAIACLGQSRSGSHEWEQAQRFVAEGRLHQALTVLTALRDRFSRAEAPGVDLAIVLDELGVVYRTLGKYEEAKESYTRAIRIADTIPGKPPVVLSRLLDNLASLYMDAGATYPQVERLRRRALALRVDEVGPEGPGIPTLLANLGTVCMAQQRYEEADALFGRALAILTKAHGNQGVDIAGVLHNMATLAVRRLRYSEAESHTRRAVATLEKSVGPDHPDLIAPLLNLARLQVQMKRLRLAEEPLSRALSIAESRLELEHPVIAEILSTRAEVYRKTGRGREAAANSRRATAIAKLHRAAPGAANSVHVSDLVRESRGSPNRPR